MDDPWDTVVSLAANRTLGATETTELAAQALALISREDIADAVETLIRGHPSMGPVWRLSSVVLSTRDHAEAAERFVSDIDDHGLVAAVVAPKLPSTVLTISCSSAVKEVFRIRKPFSVLCMASYPGGEGLQMAGLASAWSDARVIDDETAISRVPADAVLVGADAVTPTAVINKVKTNALVTAARNKGIPVFAAAGSAKLVPVELPVVHPFEGTPLELFDAVGTPGGMLAPAEAGRRASMVRLHPALPMLVEKLTEEIASGGWSDGDAAAKDPSGEDGPPEPARA